MRARSTAAIALLIALSAPALASEARAQADDPLGSCDPEVGRRPLLVLPASGAAGVTLDTFIRAEYTAGYFTDPAIGADPARSIELSRIDGELAVPVPGRAQVHGDTLFFVPDEPLLRDTAYQGVAIGRDGNIGFNFRTGSGFDTEAPQLGGIADGSSSRTGPACGAPEGGFRIDVTFTPASDDGPEGSIEYLLYLTRGEGVDAPVLKARALNFETALVTMAFVLEPSEAVSPVCMVVVAVDGAGRIDADGEPLCFDPIQGNFFEPLCAVSAPGASSLGSSGRLGGAAGALAALGVLVFLRRARRRRG